MQRYEFLPKLAEKFVTLRTRITKLLKMKKLIITAAVALAIAMAACGPKSPTGNVEADAKYLVEQCRKAEKDGKSEAAKKLTEEYMNYYKDKGTVEASEFAFAVLSAMNSVEEEDPAK